MGAVYPATHSGAVKLRYPVQRTRRYRTVVYCAIDTSEQRFSKASPLALFTLSYSSVSTTDKNLVRDFFNSRKGALDATWEITLPDPSSGSPTTYYQMQFLPNDRFIATENKPGFWEFTVRFRQTNPNLSS